MENTKKVLYVGGLPDEVDVSELKTAFLPFGNIVDINLPIDYTNQKSKGFAFIEYQMPEDAFDAIDNMDNSEIMGKTIRVNLAKPSKYRENTNRPIWANDEYLRALGGEEVSQEDLGEDGDGGVSNGEDSTNLDRVG